MPVAPASEKLLASVRRRLQVRSFGLTVSLAGCVVAVVYLAALCASRLTGIWPQLFPWQSLEVIPAGGLLLGALCHPRTPREVVARTVDQAIGSRDLYLTLALLERAAGEYQPLVIAAAEQQAATVDPARVVPMGWQRRYWHLMWVSAVAAIAVFALPQFDPFGKVAQASLSTERKDRLIESRRQTQLRVAEVQKELEERETGEETTKAIEHLQLALNKMQPQQKQLNFESLTDEQQRLAKLWKQLASDPLQKLLKSPTGAQQRFGAGEEEQMQKWNQDLQSGSTAGMQQELQELKEQLQKLAKTNDPLEKSQLQKELKERLETLQKFAQKNLEDQKLAAALQRAMSQLDLSSLDDLSADALQGAMESLELSEMELDQLAQAAQDLKNLEDALKTLQMAKRLNDFDQLDGQKSQQCKSLSDYEKLYKEMLARCQGQCRGEGQCSGCGQCQGNGLNAGNGNGAGMGGAGTGQGNIAPEDNSISTEFQNDLAKSAVTAGKVLMSLKSRGMGERGNANLDYQSLIQQVRQGASEAILQEQVPPGYHDGIKSYFDTLQKTSPTPN